MKRTELERAWPAAEPPAGFPDRVLERARRGPAPSERVARRASLPGGSTARRTRWLAASAVALGLGLGLGLGETFRRSSAPTASEGEVIAAEPRVVSIGERVVAELSSGARVRWSGDEVRQDRGEVAYRVVPGAPLRVQTPYGNIAVLGTVFRVAIAAGSEAGGDPMNERWAIAGGSAMLGALLLVSVERGSVLLSKGEDELILAAGQSGSVGADGTPRLGAAAPTSTADALRATGDAERARSRQVADAVRRHAARRRAAARAAKEIAPKPPAVAGSAPAASSMAFRPAPPAPPATSPTPATPEEARREYIQRTVREQYFPVARDCYEELLARQPTAGGQVTLEFAIVGNGDAGVVDRVALQEDETTIDDPEFKLCMRESMYTAVFEPPPPGAEETTVVYPVTLTPE